MIQLILSTFLTILAVSVALRPSSPLPFKNVVYAEYSEHALRLDRANRHCNSKPQVPPTSGFLAGESFLSISKTSDMVVPDTEQLRDRRDHGLSGGQRDLLLLPGQKASLVSFGENSGNEQSAWLPEEEFTVDLWIKADSGQENPAVIMIADDSCSPFENEGWELGISTKSDDEPFPNFYARIQATTNSRGTILKSKNTYHSDRWVHLGLTYDGEETKLYLNGARVGRSFGQKGKLFQRLHILDSASSCRSLVLGGSFRGRIAVIRLWKKALSHGEMLSALKVPLLAKDSLDIPQIASLVMWDNFEGDVIWDWSNGHSTPQLLPSTFQLPFIDLTPDIPTPCGFTICDSPEIVKSYAANWELRSPKNIRYNIINVRNDDGSNETVTKKQINAQHRALIRSFAPYNITWDFKEIVIRDTSLRRKTILIGCKPQFIGNGNCDPKCSEIPTTNNDGGDCDSKKKPCRPSKQGNGKCDSACNVAYHKWDKGDCCDPSITDVTINCLDPSSPNKAFLSLEEYKNIISAPSDQGVNIFFAHWTNTDIVGLATFPWEKEARTTLGGVLVRPEDFGVEGQMDTLVHELGHVLGLWHVHRGVSELECDHPCFESEASFTSGDLCSDTKPTIAHSACRDPNNYRFVCGTGPFTETPFNNYMSYSDDSCADTFTAQQVARMHCYVDLAYPSWLTNSVEVHYPPPPLAPRVISTSSKGVSIGWIPPINQALYLQNDDSCRSCTPERSLFQYAEIVTGYREAHGEYGTPREASGPPDSESCSPSVLSWMPDPFFCAPTNGSQEACSLSVTFKVPVVPYSVSIWMNFNSRLGLSEVLLVFTDGSIASLGPAKSACGERFTFVVNQILPRLTIEKEVKEVKGLVLYASSSYVSVDAVRLTSIPNHPTCSLCKPVRYMVHRDPPFSNGQNFVETGGTEFTDSFREEDAENYRYHVRAFSSSKVSLPSPGLIYRIGQDICGDGAFHQATEECDDGNLIGGDGCDKYCQLEAGFFCYGSPSTCYWHEGDEVCEPSERERVFEDCGSFTPHGFTDQWAERVETFPELDNPDCPVLPVAGPPMINPKECNNEHNSSVAWRPCSVRSINHDHLQLEAFFKHAAVAASVMIYLESDGKLLPEKIDFEGRRTGMHLVRFQHDVEAEATVELIGINGEITRVGPVSLYCSKNPITISIKQDLTRPFITSKGVRIRFPSSSRASFAAVALRSLSWNPMTVSRCLSDSLNSLYSPILDECLSYRERVRVPCNEPLVKNGRLECTGFQEGDICSLGCDRGYFLPEAAEYRGDTKSARVTCVNGNWLGNSLTCRPIDCQLPRIPHADALCPEGTTYGRSCSFKCRPPARLRTTRNGANGSSVIVTCTKSGVWSDPEPLCHLSCPVPPAPENAILVDERCDKRKMFAFGQKCKFRCRYGYDVWVDGAKRKFFESRCDGSGLWNSEVCVPGTCHPPDMREGGSLKCSDDFRFGSICTLECQMKKDGLGSADKVTQRFSSVCESDGKWTPPFKFCPPTADYCPTPILPSSAKTTCDSGGLTEFKVWPIGQKCHVSCVQIEPEVFGAEKLEEESTIQCTGQGTWYPSPESFNCGPKCVKNLPEIYLEYPQMILKKGNRLNRNGRNGMLSPLLTFPGHNWVMVSRSFAYPITEDSIIDLGYFDSRALSKPF